MPYEKRKEDWVNTTDYIDQADVDAWETAIYELKTGGGGIDIRDYGASTASSDNSAAVQDALSAVDAGGTGVIMVPPGTWKFTGTLTIPRGRTVILRGCGRENSKLSWQTDLGAGEYAIKMASGFPNQERIHVEHLTMVGPSTTGPPPYGVADALMYGLDVTNGVIVSNVRVGSFYAGFIIGGNHSTIRDSSATTCYYGMYRINSSTMGNHTFDTLVLYGNFAGMASQKNQGFAGELFNQVHWIDSPYGWYRETGAASTSVFVGGSHFSGCSFESMGNGAIYDEDMDGIIESLTFSGCGSATNFYSGTQIAGRDADYDVRCGQWNNILISSSPDMFRPGDLGIFQCGGMANFEWYWQSNLIGDLSASVSPVVGCDPTNAIWHSYAGKTVIVRTTTTCNANDLMVVDTFGTVKKATTGAPAGVALHAAGVNDKLVLLIENPGFVTGTGKINTSDTAFDAGEWVKLDTVNAGQVVVGSSATDGTPVGVAKAEDSGGLVEVWLRGLH